MEEIIILDEEGTRGMGEEEVWVEERGWDPLEGKVVVVVVIVEALVEMC